MSLFSMQEIQAVLALLNRLPMSPAEMLFATNFFQRLATFCKPPKPEPEPEPEPGLTEDQGRAMADALAIADALDAADKEPE